MQKLNFPTYNFRLRKNKEDLVEIFDPTRKKWLILTPEEWVRQHWIRFLTIELAVPIALIGAETGLKIGERNKRSDVLVFKNGSPILLVECKSHSIPINQAVLNQIISYNSQYQCKFLVLSNGINHKLFEVDYKNSKLNEINELNNFEKW